MTPKELSALPAMTPKELGALPAMPAAGDYRGLTIRQQFAMAAMQGLLASGRIDSGVATSAISYAESLITKLCEEQP